MKLTLRPGVAEKIFHITAEKKCHFNFALNRASRNCHCSDIGGGYLPITKEHLFLTRPAMETVQPAR
ncbi:hypothetical protein F6X50_19715 [Dickeya dianthicola]|uniref:hypothetical protein n=1 Tax=Dickeya dianthicola TaxID=204039 RepID=UPI00136F3B8D|nr:hypothetical protein [Dickeya dianthicola]MCI4239274.1 hypothetical protein [Dickeya dianthicola]MZI91268.1 hypothetical protein [Dickeya dianthicola]